MRISRRVQHTRDIFFRLFFFASLSIGDRCSPSFCDCVVHSLSLFISFFPFGFTVSPPPPPSLCCCFAGKAPCRFRHSFPCLTWRFRVFVRVPALLHLPRCEPVVFRLPLLFSSLIPHAHSLLRAHSATLLSWVGVSSCLPNAFRNNKE